MSNPEIQGFSPLQRDLADRIWSMDTEEEITEFVSAMPRNLKREAWVVMQMIIAAELDRVDHVDPELESYLRSR